MAIKTYTISPKPEQNLDSIYAFGKGLISRGIISGVLKEAGSVKLMMLPESAARYEKNSPSFESDVQAVEEALKAAGYADAPAETPAVKVTPISIPAKVSPAKVSPTPATVAPVAPTAPVAKAA